MRGCHHWYWQPKSGVLTPKPCVVKRSRLFMALVEIAHNGERSLRRVDASAAPW
jgi:hypothetical protein